MFAGLKKRLRREVIHADSDFLGPLEKARAFGMTYLPDSRPTKLGAVQLLSSKIEIMKRLGRRLREWPEVWRAVDRDFSEPIKFCPEAS